MLDLVILLSACTPVGVSLFHGYNEDELKFVFILHI